MKKFFKRYFALTSTGYRIVSLILLPLLIAGITELYIVMGGKNAGVMLIQVWVYVLIFEVIADVWFLGGSCIQNAHEMEYLKTSLSGTKLIKHGVIGDILRRALYFSILILLVFVQTKELQYLLVGILNFSVVMIILNITRALSGANQVMMISVFLGSVLEVLVFLLTWFVQRAGMKMFILVTVAAVVLAVAVSIFTVWHVMHCVKGDYYEKGSGQSF